MKTILFLLLMSSSAMAQSCVDPEPYHQPKPGSIMTSQKSEWQDMWQAPRDGTVVELRAAYGVALHYGLFKWDPSRKWWLDVQHSSDGNFSGQGYMEERCLSWRPYESSAEGYVDPTGGAHDTREYELHAAARSAGLPEDYWDDKKPWYKFW